MVCIYIWIYMVCICGVYIYKDIWRIYIYGVYIYMIDHIKDFWVLQPEAATQITIHVAQEPDVILDVSTTARLRVLLSSGKKLIRTVTTKQYRQRMFTLW